MAGAGHGTKNGLVPAIKGARVGEPRPAAPELARLRGEARRKAELSYRRKPIRSDEVVAGLGDLARHFHAGAPDEGRGVELSYRGQNRAGNHLDDATFRLKRAGFDVFPWNAVTLHVTKPTGRSERRSYTGAR